MLPKQYKELPVLCERKSEEKIDIERIISNTIPTEIAYLTFKKDESTGRQPYHTCYALGIEKVKFDEKEPELILHYSTSMDPKKYLPRNHFSTPLRNIEEYFVQQSIDL